MTGTFTAVIEVADEGGYWAWCAEVPGASGQGESPEEAKQSLAEAIRIIMKDRCEDALRGIPRSAIFDEVQV